MYSTGAVLYCIPEWVRGFARATRCRTKSDTLSTPVSRLTVLAPFPFPSSVARTCRRPLPHRPPSAPFHRACRPLQPLPMPPSPPHHLCGRTPPRAARCASPQRRRYIGRCSRGGAPHPSPPPPHPWDARRDAHSPPHQQRVRRSSCAGWVFPHIPRPPAPSPSLPFPPRCTAALPRGAQWNNPAGDGARHGERGGAVPRAGAPAPVVCFSVGAGGFSSPPPLLPPPPPDHRLCAWQPVPRPPGRCPPPLATRDGVSSCAEWQLCGGGGGGAAAWGGVRHHGGTRGGGGGGVGGRRAHLTPSLPLAVAVRGLALVEWHGWSGVGVPLGIACGGGGGRLQRVWPCLPVVFRAQAEGGRGGGVEGCSRRPALPCRRWCVYSARGGPPPSTEDQPRTHSLDYSSSVA